MDLTEWYRNNDNEAIRLSFQQGEAKGEAQGNADGEARGKTEGMIKGNAKALLKVMQARGLAVTAAQQERVLRCQDEAQLDQWLIRALTASSTAEVLEIP